MTVAQAIAVATLRLRQGPGVASIVRASALSDAQLLLGEVLHEERAWLLAHGDQPLTGDLLALYGRFIDERQKGMPVPYLTHRAGFYGREFYVDEHVLVPRPESEHIIEAAIDDVRARIALGARTVAVCDVGTGSGALGLTIAAECVHATLVAGDASSAALAVARRNALTLGLNERATFVVSDLGQALMTLGPFDCVVANLPYVPSARVPAPPDPVGFEPRLALDGGADGLALYRRFIGELPALAGPGASAYLEAAPGTIEPLATLVEAAFPHAHIEIGEDYAGCERFIAVSALR